jgi:hypothetical protein
MNSLGSPLTYLVHQNELVFKLSHQFEKLVYLCKLQRFQGALKGSLFASLNYIYEAN